MEGKFNFKKKFGQNFLKNKSMIEKIVSVADIKKNSLIIEVGAGSGALTKHLAKANENSSVLCYEVDETLKSILENNLKEHQNITILYGDFLKQDIKKDIERFSYDYVYFVSNVPYYITTPILFKLLSSKILFSKIVMMVQKEVGDRFTASPGTKNYGSLTVLLNYYFNTKREFFVDRNQFIPKPNVDSVVISLVLKEEHLKLKNKDFFEKLVRDSFQYKRKTIRNNLKNYDLEKIEKVLKKYGYDLMVRAEQLDYRIFVDLANVLS